MIPTREVAAKTAGGFIPLASHEPRLAGVDSFTVLVVSDRRWRQVLGRSYNYLTEGKYPTHPVALRLAGASSPVTLHIVGQGFIVA